MKSKPYTVYNSAQELEDARLMEAASATYTERFHKLMKLIKISKMISNATIISSPVMPKKL